MTRTQSEDEKAALLARLAAHTRRRVPQGERTRLLHFIAEYYRQTAPEDLLERDLLVLYGAALAHWRLARRRQAGEVLVHAYNPEVEAHGWQSTHTVVDVVHEDMPFLVDSIRMALNRRGLSVHLIVHPVMRVQRDAKGQVQALGEEADPGSPREALMHFEVDRHTDLERVEADLNRVLAEVRAAVGDWGTMRAALHTIVRELREAPPPLAGEDTEEAVAFLEWLEHGHFTLLGYRRYRLESDGDDDVLRTVAGSGLGILRGTHSSHSHSFARLPAALRRFARQQQLLLLTKSSSRSNVHRPVYMDYVGIRCFDAQGTVTGEHRFLGLYTAAAYNRSAQGIPVLRRKVRHVLQRSGLDSTGHAGKALTNILETLPRGELFQSSTEELYATALGVLRLQERQRVRVLVRRDPYERFLALLAFLPRERYNTEVRMRIQELLRRSLHATSVDFTVALSESVLARVYLIAHTEPGAVPEYDLDNLEAHIREVVRTWEDDLHDCFLHDLGEERGNYLFARYRDAFPAAYRDDYPAAVAVHDAEKIEALSAEAPLATALYRPLEGAEDQLQLKLFRHGEPISLSVVLPMLENMGLEVVGQRPYRIRPSDDTAVWVQDIALLYRARGNLEAEDIRQTFLDAFARIWQGEAESDGFNRLVLAARLSWREAALLRAYWKYLMQTGFPFSQAYVEQALARHPQIASLLIDLFRARFDPAGQDDAAKRSAILSEALLRSLDAVPVLDEDRILRRFLLLVDATRRTNFFQSGPGGHAKPYLAIKVDPRDIPDLPAPRPMVEVFVYAVHMEGIHLRGGKVARGGIRWSDRPEDFRTEIFGLMKAQMAKNAVIVPVGAKGGFVVKRPPNGGTPASTDAVRESYCTLIRGLLDLTDNLSGGEVQPPPATVCLDDPDPYLVVAADKGTATFSDTANAIAKEYGFWLGDAFASGGSSGYDHKRMGITARGAWELVKRHFREMGRDIQAQDFTVAGIGSMNGDVFGNGMLLSPHIRLIAAFSHREIFLDPAPDAARSFAERQRLFALPRASWSDYDPALISAGGGVYPRSAKRIALGPEARAALGTTAQTLTPDELVRTILCAPVDLLWNGGIGTFVKAAAESHAAAGDRSNDAVRVDAQQLRCKVIGEGGNLGLTFEARIAYARGGGRLNTDFIDNSGGVDCSDHEVNIKVLLDEVVAEGDMTRKQRDRLLQQMTEPVAQLVLANNYQQGEVLSVATHLGVHQLDQQAELIRHLERSGRIERATWHLPEEEEIAQRQAAGEGLTRPELAVLLAYSKIDVFETLLPSGICEDPRLQEEMSQYFPEAMRRRLRTRLPHHRLRREIIATFVANSLINHMGITFAHRIAERSGADAPEIARAYMVSRRVFRLPEYWAAVAALDNRITAARQLDLLIAVRKLGSRATLWLLRNRPPPIDIAANVAALEDRIGEVRPALAEVLHEEERQHLEARAAEYRSWGLEESDAAFFAAVAWLPPLLDVAEIAAGAQTPALEVARIYFALAARLDLNWLRDAIAALSEDRHWARLARAALRDDLFWMQRRLARQVLDASDTEAPAQRIDAWMQRHRAALEVFGGRMREFAAEEPELPVLSVALDEVRRLVRAVDA